MKNSYSKECTLGSAKPYPYQGEGGNNQNIYYWYIVRHFYIDAALFYTYYTIHNQGYMYIYPEKDIPPLLKTYTPPPPPSNCPFFLRFLSSCNRGVPTKPRFIYQVVNCIENLKYL